MSPSILLVPVEPPPPGPVLAALASRLEQVFARAVRVTDPLGPPAAARRGTDHLAAGPVEAALAATWGCGCRDRVVGVTSAALDGATRTGGCGGVLAVSLPPGGGAAPLVRAVGRSLGLEDCAEPACAMHPGAGGAELCRGCRGRC